jgi:predicted nucleotide-binding protein (sugar kinase/HSP70/actin superfamily)
VKITFPHMGSLYIAVEALLQELGHDVVVPPPTTKRTLELGVRYGPEVACLPFKVMIGNLLEARALGADTVLMIGGTGPCRLGYYAEVQRQILEELGTGLEVLVLEQPLENPARLRGDLRELFRGRRVSRLPWALYIAWEKLKACEALEELALVVRPREKALGLTSQVLAQALREVREAGGVRAVHQALKLGKVALRDAGAPGKDRVHRIGVVGEIYTVLEPFVNLRLEERLGQLGAEVVRTISVVEWVRNHVLKGSVGLYKTTKLERSAVGYLRGWIGGHGLESVARANDLAADGVDGVVHILPFTCMPEVVAQAILEGVARDREVPILSLVVDEHTAEAGFQTRLEAFTDLIRRSERWAVHV